MPPALQNPFVLWVLASAAFGGLTYAFVRKELRVRATVYGAFLIACFVALWPPYERNGEPGKIHLGLDLKGGIHLVLQVVTDDALAGWVDDRVQSVRNDLTERGITYETAERVSSTGYTIAGVGPARVKDAREILRDWSRSSGEPGGWDIREPGEGSFTVTMSEPLVRHLKDRTVKEAIRTLERRVNQLGVAEPVIAQHGNKGDQILVQLPGVRDPEQAKRVIQRTAQLTLKEVEGSGATREGLLESRQGKLPEDMQVLTGSGDEPGEQIFYLVRKEAVITGRDLKNARVGVDRYNQPAVNFTLNPQGATKIREFSRRHIGDRMAIVLDDRIESAPTIEGKLGADNQITGRFTTQEADELAKVLRAGALPADLKYLQELTVGASLGADSVRSGVMASLAGMAFIALFMLGYYRLSGLNAVVALAANLLILFGTMAYFAATLTLPGIAGIILTMGVGVDTNVLVFERIREELRQGKTVKAAIANGFDRVWIIILDTHATALIAATFLFQFGTGPIKGFAVTLVVGLVANVFASYFVSKLIFELVLGKRPVSTLSIGADLFQSPKFDFLGKARYAVVLSLLVIAGGVFMMQRYGVKYGVEFSGGTQLIASFRSTPEIDRVRDAVWKTAPGATIQRYDRAEKNEVLVRIGETGEEKDITQPAQLALQSLKESYSENPVEGFSTETVGPIVGAELRHKAMLLVILGLCFQLIYIGVRFKGAIWGAAAAIAALHDVIATLAFLSFFKFEITLNVIAALLTLVGYSVNDTIVIFDRARENLRQKHKEPLPGIVNRSINQTLARTMITSGTTFLAVLGLFLFGGEALQGFAFTMVVGVIVGTYSTMFIASPLVTLWDRLAKRRAAS